MPSRFHLVILVLAPVVLVAGGVVAYQAMNARIFGDRTSGTPGGAPGISIVESGTAPVEIAQAPQPKPERQPEPQGEPSNRWSARCDPGDGGALQCRVLTTIRVRSTNQRLFSVVFTRPNVDAPLRMTLALPHGVYFPAGVEVQVDETDGRSVPVQTSDANGAYAMLNLTQEQVSTLTAGTSMTAAFLSADQKTVRIRIGLAGLEEALRALETRR